MLCSNYAVTARTFQTKATIVHTVAANIKTIVVLLMGIHGKATSNPKQAVVGYQQ